MTYRRLFGTKLKLLGPGAKATLVYSQRPQVDNGGAIAVVSVDGPRTKLPISIELDHLRISYLAAAFPGGLPGERLTAEAHCLQQILGWHA